MQSNWKKRSKTKQRGGAPGSLSLNLRQPHERRAHSHHAHASDSVPLAPRGGGTSAVASRSRAAHPVTTRKAPPQSETHDTGNARGAKHATRGDTTSPTRRAETGNRRTLARTHAEINGRAATRPERTRSPEGTAGSEHLCNTSPTSHA